MNVTAEHAGGAVVLELDEGCRSVAALWRIISEALRHLRKDGFDVTVQGRVVEDVDVCGLEEGSTIQVVESRRVVALDALRAAGRDVSEVGLKKGIISAVCDEDVTLCEQYLDAGCDVHALDRYGRTPLHLAAYKRLPECCTLLLQRGANINQRCGANCTPLRSCFLWQNPEDPAGHAVREVLLSHGADMRAADSSGKSALDRARMERKRVFSTRVARRGGEWRKQLSPYDALDQFVKYGAPDMRWLNPCRKKYSWYIHKLAKVQFKERKQQITAKGMGVVNAFVTDVLERLGGEAGRVTSFSGAKTLSVRSVVAAVKLQLPEELATHALAAGTAAVGRYAKACGGVRIVG